MINLSEQTLDKQLIARIETMEAAIRDLKTPQAIGSDVINVSLLSAEINFSIGPNARDNMRITGYIQQLRQYFISEPGISMFLGVDNDIDHLWPDGSALTSAQKNIRRELTYDVVTSDELVTGAKSYILSIWNPDNVATLTVFLKFRLIYPQLNVTG